MKKQTDPLELNLKELPKHTHHGLRDYVEHGIKPGSFLVAVLCNNLFEAARLADTENRALLANFPMVINRELPTGSFGNHELVNKWILSGGRQGIKNSDDLPHY